MKSKHLRTLLVCTATALLAFAPHTAPAASASERNEKLLAADEPYEGLTETAIDGNAAKIAKAFKAAEAGRTATRALLAPATAARFDVLFTALAAAHAKPDHLDLALQSAELYKLIVSACDAATLVVPMEVSLLDYAGFRTNALLKSPSPDWAALGATALEANGNWSKIRSRVTDKKLLAGMDAAQRSLAAAAEKHDAALSHASAKNDLDLVDDLEKFFAK